MQQHIFAIRDIKAGLYGHPVIKVTHAVMERDLGQMSNDPNHPVSQHPEDHDLYYLGTYDNETGAMDLLAHPKHIANALTYVRKPDQKSGQEPIKPQAMRN